mgnify:FL=1
MHDCGCTLSDLSAKKLLVSDVQFSTRIQPHEGISTLFAFSRAIMLIYSVRPVVWRIVVWNLKKLFYSLAMVVDGKQGFKNMSLVDVILTIKFLNRS